MEGGITLTVNDLQYLLGIDNYRSAAKQLQNLRDANCKKGRKLTIREYCEIEDLDFDYVWKFLRGNKLPPYGKFKDADNKSIE